MSRFSKYLSLPARGLLFGCLLGLGVVASRKSLAEAQSTLFFPPRLVFRSEVPPEQIGGKSPESGEATVDPVVWAQDTLMSKASVDALCKRIDRSDMDKKAEALRSAILLSEDKRIHVTTLPNSCVRLQVLAEDPKVAVVLCEGLLAYLTFKTKIPLEDPDADKLVTTERALRVKEKALSGVLWGLMAFDAPKSQDPNALESVTLDLQEYQLDVAQYRQAMRDHFFREARTAAGGNSFVILEPPSAVRDGRPWIFGALVGGAAGILASFLFQRRAPQAAPRQNVRWRIQEREPAARTASVDPVKGDE